MKPKSENSILFLSDPVGKAANKNRTYGSDRGSALPPVLFIFFISALISIIYLYHEDIHIPKISRDPFTKIEGGVNCTVIMTVRDRTLRMSFSMPYGDKQQKEQIMMKLPIIKHDLMLSSDDFDFVACLENRDFASLKSYIAKIINRYLDRPVDKVYFEQLWYN